MTRTARSCIHIYLDVTRLIEHATRHMPAGIDRTEYAYAIYLARQDHIKVSFVFYHPLHGISVINRHYMEDFLACLNRLWNHSAKMMWHLRWLIARIYVMTRPMRAGTSDGSSCYYLILSHHHLTRPKEIGAFVRKTHAQLVVMIHDLIPILFPEYSGPREERRHRRRLQTIQEFQAHIITPTQAVADDLRPFISPDLRVKTIMHGIAPMKVTHEDIARAPIPHAPYFIYVSTIEPRKNHLLLLNIWRRMAHYYSHNQMPHLILAGRRGWENENIIDMLDRCAVIKDYVHEYNHLDDRQINALLSQSRALVFPSFAEGFGLPLAEAFLTNTVSICSDLPVFHEIAQNGAYFLDPLDGPSWINKIHMLTTQPRRMTQKELFPDAPPKALYPWPHQIQQTLCWLQNLSLS